MPTAEGASDAPIGEPPADVATHGGLERLVVFGDAVVAIAITLLVLPLVELPGESPGVGALDLVRDHVWDVVSFLISFVVIARLWLIHHALFERVELYDRPLLKAQFLWLLTIVVLPFPTELLGTSNNSQSASAMYIAVLAASSWCLAWMRAHIDRSPALRNALPAAPRTLPWLTPGLMTLAFLLALTVPDLGAWALLVAALDGPIHALHRRRARAVSGRAR